VEDSGIMTHIKEARLLDEDMDPINGDNPLPVGLQSPLDSASGALMSIPFEHHEMHEGDHYFFKTFLVDTGGNGSTTIFSFTTPNSAKRVHARSLFTPDADYTVSIHEGATVTGGTPLNGFNNDRDSSNIAEMSALSAPTISAPGDLIWASRNGGGRRPVGVSPGFSYEIIAKTNTTYTFTIVKNVVNQPQIVDIDFWWYEHTPSA